MTRAGDGALSPESATPGRWISALERESEQARSIESAVAGAEGVAALSAGDEALAAPPHGVRGIRFDDDQVEVRVVADYGTPLQITANNIGRAVAPILDGRALQVSIEDILLPGEQLTPADGAAVPGAARPGQV
ncbi:hypothetical protein ABIB25_004823 [Nakamurella sp. UYEF19]|uniref:hypothetical protein n=1 Tax=Nakamurella sp. UYEF19 TaxID=1756392 RepID=UPI00339B52AB